MKKTLSLILALVICLSFCACGGNNNNSNGNEGNEINETSSKAQYNDIYVDMRESLTETQIEEMVESEAVRSAIEKLENMYGTNTLFIRDSTRYKIGSIIKTGNYEYEVNGTLYLYDKYDDLIGTTKFTCTHVSIDPFFGEPYCLAVMLDENFY